MLLQVDECLCARLPAHFVVTDWPSQIRPHCTGYVFPRNTAEIRHTLVWLMRAPLIVTPECWQNLLSDATRSQIRTDRPHHSYISASLRVQIRSSRCDTVFCYANTFSFNSWRDCSSKNLNFVIIYSPSCNFKLMWLYFFCETLKELFIGECQRWK